MAAAVATNAKHNRFFGGGTLKQFCILVPVQKADDLARKTLQSLKAQTLKEWECRLVPEGDASAAQELLKFSGNSEFDLAPRQFESLADMMNWAVNDSGAKYVLPLVAGVELQPDALQKIIDAFARNKNAAGVFSSYREVSHEGKEKPIQLYPHEGAFHERFDFGYVKVYDAEKVKEIGGFRTDLKHAAEYDVDLKLTDKYSFDLIDQAIYSVHLPPPAANGGGAGSSALYSPGKGTLGGFSYVFYPPDLEKEVTSVFEEMLHRRGAYITHDTVEVPYPKDKKYEVLATVVIPVLNRAKFIGNAIERVLEGTFKDFEVVVIDNASTDGTQDVVRSYAEKDPRVRLVQRGGGTIASALNEGIRAARGKYICQLDSDDEYTPDTLQKMVDHMESHPKCGLAISYYELMDENRGKVEGIEPVTHKGYSRNQILRRDGGGALRVFPKVVLEEMGYYDEEHFGNFGEDYDMVLKTGEKYDVDRVHHVLYRYRRHSDNTDVTRDPLMKIQNKNNARLNALRRRQEINKRQEKAPAK